jgi:putative tryptophan/tyrosine transport system substrate-binding protein
MDRRRFTAFIGGVLALPIARAQKTAALPIVGILTPHARNAMPGPNPFRDRLQQLGWVDGENYVFDRPDAGGREDRLPAIAEELVRKGVRVIFALGPEAAVAAARATKSIPIVFWGVAWPIEQGLVDSLARPGRNVTGMAFSVGTEWQKVMEALREVAPKANRIAVIATPSGNSMVAGGVYQSSVNRVQQMGFEMQRFEIARAEDIDGALAAALAWRPQALYVPGTTLTLRERKRFAEFAALHRLPAVFNMGQFVAAGGLLSYGIDSTATILHTAGYVDRILRGAKPADLPVELPTRYEFVINAKTAAALGLKIPQSMLLRVDRVIE